MSKRLLDICVYVVLNKINNKKNIFIFLFCYFSFLLLWVLFFDDIISGIIPNNKVLSIYQNYKGIWILIISSLVIYWILKTYFEKNDNKMFRISSVLDNSPDVIARLDKNLKYTYVNSKAEEIFQKPASKLLGNTVDVFNFPKDLINKRNRELKTVFEERKEKRVELVYPTEQGMKYFDVRLVPEFDESNEVVSVLYIGRNITPLKQKEKKLQNLNEILDTIRNVNRIINKVNNKKILLSTLTDILISSNVFTASFILHYGENGNLINFYDAGLKNNIKQIINKFKAGFPDIKELQDKKDILVINSFSSLFSNLDKTLKKNNLILTNIKYRNRYHGILGIFISPQFYSKHELQVFRELARDIAIALNRLED